MTSFYYYDQNPSGFCFLVQIRAFVIQTSLGLQNLNMKGRTKGFWWRHRANGLLPLLVVKFQESLSRELHILKTVENSPTPSSGYAMQIQEKSFLLILYILSLTFPRKKRKTLCYMALIKREILTSREVLYAALHA